MISCFRSFYYYYYLHACPQMRIGDIVAVVVDVPKYIKIRYIGYIISTAVIENLKMTSACAAEKARGLDRGGGGGAVLKRASV